MTKFFKKDKDGGPESKVWAYWVVECKRLCSIAFLHFEDGGREVFHSHAFNAISWVIKGELNETVCHDPAIYTKNRYLPSLKPIFTPRHRTHMVKSTGDTLVFTLRGPWVKYWHEQDPMSGSRKVLGHGRKEVAL